MPFGLLLQNPMDQTLWGDGVMDIVYDASGHVATLSGAENVRHYFLKAILTGRTNNYGTTVPFLIGAKQPLLARAAIAGTVTEFVTQAIAAQPATLPDSERVVSIDSLSVNPIRGNASQLRLSLSLKLASGSLVAIEHQFKEI